jgi:hypothetical protein
MGATFEGPLFHVDLLLACGRVFATGISVAAWTGDGRGATFSFPDVCDVPVVLSDRPIKDFLNHEDFEDEVGAASAESFEAR